MTTRRRTPQLGAHENNYGNATHREARARYLEQREARRQECMALAIVTWDAGAA